MSDDGVSDDHSITFHLAERNKAVAGGDIEDRRGGLSPRVWIASSTAAPKVRDFLVRE